MAALKMSGVRGGSGVLGARGVGVIRPGYGVVEAELERGWAEYEEEDAVGGAGNAADGAVDEE